MDQQQDSSPDRMKLAVTGRKDGRFSISLTGAPLALAQDIVAQITVASVPTAPPRSAPPGIYAVFCGDLMECSYFMDAPKAGDVR